MGKLAISKLFDLPNDAPCSQIAWFDDAFWIGGELGVYGRLARARQINSNTQWVIDYSELPANLDPHVSITAMVSGNDQKGEFLVIGLGYFQPINPPLEHNLVYTSNTLATNSWTLLEVGRKENGGLEAPPVYAISCQIVENAEQVMILYIGVHETSIVRTNDYGKTYKFASGTGQPEMSYSQMMLAHGSRLWTGIEAPLDDAWGSWANISEGMNAPVPLKFTRSTGGLHWENRRPNCIVPSPTRPDIVYFGLEGAVVEMKADKDVVEGKWLACWGSDGEAYPYIKGIAIDPYDPSHLVCGGFDKANQSDPFALFELMNGSNEPAPIILPDLPMGDQVYVSSILTLSNSSRFAVLVSPMEGYTGQSSVYELSFVP